MEIPKIAIPHNRVGIQPIPRVYTPEWLKEAPTVIPPAPPVTSQIGVPIVNILVVLKHMKVIKSR
ncbi:MAG: hypothetical protein CM15mV41_0390 [Caudoviricetes sp.]|nr:MAG: hypothetical protein CM15mV41_0390 [Caudoviricetes sp.]